MSSSIEYGLVISSSLPMVVCGVGALGPAPRPSLVTTFAAAEVLGDTAQWLLDRVGAVVHVEGVLICDWVRGARCGATFRCASALGAETP